MRSEKPTIALRSCISITAIILGALFSFFLVVGRSIRLRTDFSLIAEAPVKAVLFFFLFWIILTVLLTLLYKWMDLQSMKTAVSSSLEAVRSSESMNTGGIAEKAKVPALKDFKHPILTRMLILLVMWSLVQIWFLPGNVPADPWHQLKMVMGYQKLNTHHPLFSTLTTGAIYRFGLMIGGQNLGTFLCVLVQDLFASFSFASMITYVRQKSRSAVLGIICLIFMGIYLPYPAYLVSLGKDALYWSYLTLFMLACVRIMLKDEKRYTKVVLVVFGILSCMQRHDALYLVVPTLFLLIFIIDDRQNRKRILISLVLIILVAFAERLFISRVLHLHTDRQTEALSLPLQQIGRYVTKHGSELTDEEIAVIDAVIIYDGIPERYDPVHSNGIKNYSRKEATKQDWIRFFQLWAEKLTEHPLTYLEATMNFVSGYTDPLFVRNHSLDLYQYGVDKDAVQFASYLFPESIRTIGTDYRFVWFTKYPMRLFMSVSLYYWIYMIMIGAVLRKKKNRKRVLFFVFPFLVFAICIASPISGSIRYSMPAITALPLYMMITVLSYRHIADGHNPEISSASQS